jgi:hypothetical protein
VEDRRIRGASLFEWLAAAFAVLGLLWVFSVPVQRMLGPRVEAAIGAPNQHTPSGVPAGATLVPVMLLLDGREIRQGDLHTRLEEILPARLAEGPAHLSDGQFGNRHTRAYALNGTKFYVVCERTEPNGQMKVAGIYLP